MNSIPTAETFYVKCETTAEQLNLSSAYISNNSCARVDKVAVEFRTYHAVKAITGDVLSATLVGLRSDPPD